MWFGSWATTITKPEAAANGGRYSRSRKRKVRIRVRYWNGGLASGLSCEQGLAVCQQTASMPMESCLEILNNPNMAKQMADLEEIPRRYWVCYLDTLFFLHPHSSMGQVG